MAAQDNKSLSVNGIYEKYGDGSNIRIYFRKIDVKCMAPSFYVAKPIAIRVGDTVEDDAECLDFTFVLKDHMVSAINLVDYQYWVLEIKAETKTFTDREGENHKFHSSTISYVRNPKAIEKLSQYGMKADKVFEYNEDFI